MGSIIVEDMYLKKNKADNGQDSLKFIHYVILFVAKISSVEGIHGKKES